MLSKKFVWPFSFYFLIFAGVAAHGPYRVLYYQSLSFTGAQIGLLVGITPLITMVSLPLITSLADRTNRHSMVMNISLLIVIAGLIILPYLTDFTPIFGVAIVFAIFFSPVLSLANSASMFMLGDQKELYGRVRLGGTIGFSIVAAIAGVLVENQGLKIAFWSGALIFFITFLVSQKLVHAEETSDQTANKGQVADLLKNPHFLLFLLIGLSGGISFATLNTYFFPYMQELGAGEAVMGLALTIGTIVEMPVLFFVNRFITRFKAYPLLIFALAMTGLRFLLLGIAPNPTFVLFVQLLNGLNYPLLTVAAVTYADEQAPVGYRATAQGWFNAATGGFGGAIGGFIGGLMMESIGGKGMYLIFFGFVILVLIVVSLIKRSLPPEETAYQPVTG